MSTKYVVRLASTNVKSLYGAFSADNAFVEWGDKQNAAVFNSREEAERSAKPFEYLSCVYEVVEIANADAVSLSISDLTIILCALHTHEKTLSSLVHPDNSKDAQDSIHLFIHQCATVRARVQDHLRAIIDRNRAKQRHG